MWKHLLLLLITPLFLGRAVAFAPQRSSRQRPSPLSAGKSTSEAASQNVFGVVSDAVTGAAFSLLHAFDDCGIEDSSKNLRVLWVRALLNSSGLIDDEVAATLLPKTTRGLVTTHAKLFDPVLKFTEWIQARTEFIDTALDRFLATCMDENGAPLKCNVVLFGAGYDTRVLRNRHRHDYKINFIEVDLPSVVEGKSKLYKKFQTEMDPKWDLEKHGSTLVGFDLNQCGGDDPASLIEVLREKGGLKRDIPTFFVWEAVLFYVDEDAVRNIMSELFEFAQKDGNGNAETLLCFTDSLKPFVDVPFTNEATKFFSEHNLDLLEHRSRWGGAVHFALAATKGQVASDTKDENDDKSTTTSSTLKKDRITGRIGRYISEQVGGLVNSYTPTQANNPSLLKNPSFDNCWYSVGYSWQMDGYETAVEAALNEGKPKKHHDTAAKPFATRLWGEPLVIYRDENGELVALADVCPHRSAPLSMGTVENGQLVCFYHGWRFGKEGACEDIPTLQAVETRESNPVIDARAKDMVTKANCGNHRAVVERDGVVYVWRGNVLEADVSLLPSKRKGDMDSVPMDTVLDYNVDYSYIVENNLDSPHLFYLHDGSVPPIEEIGLMNQNLPKLRLTAFTDDCGYGHLGKLGADGRPKKLIRFDPPNIVRHGGVSGFEEEFHCIPIAPGRTRVLIRQHLPKGPILSTITSIPFLKPALTALVNSWNYHIGLEDAAVMQGQANRIEDWGAPRMTVGGLGDDLIKRYWKWRAAAHAALEPDEAGMQTPYFAALQNNGMGSLPSGIPSGTSLGDSPEVVAQLRADFRRRNSPLVSDDGRVDPDTGKAIGTWGIKQNYLQNTPAANFPPMNYKPYANLLVLDDLVKSLFVGQEPSSTMIKTAMADLDSRGKARQKASTGAASGNLVGEVVWASFVLSMTDAVVGGTFSRAAAAVLTDMLPGEAALGLEQRLAMSTMLFNGLMDFVSNQ